MESGMIWDQYLNHQLLERGLAYACIIGLDGNTLACSSGLNLQPEFGTEIVKCKLRYRYSFM